MDEDDTTALVIGGAHRVFNTLGSGLPEVVYVGALAHECRKAGLEVAREFPIVVWYDGVVVRSYRADLLINRVLLVEVKSGELSKAHAGQTLNYVRCSDVELALLIGFGTRPVVRRFVMRSSLKHRVLHSGAHVAAD
ncbi:MAG TPA: GxxExxY protein [Gemmatimonadaceae bacterium]|nr:GxxExxY protein [Gemmatimonadaceae bacterium]